MLNAYKILIWKYVNKQIMQNASTWMHTSESLVCQGLLVLWQSSRFYVPQGTSISFKMLQRVDWRFLSSSEVGMSTTSRHSLILLSSASSPLLPGHVDFSFKWCDLIQKIIIYSFGHNKRWLKLIQFTWQGLF